MASGSLIGQSNNFNIKGFRAVGPWSTWTPSSSKRFVSGCGRHLQWHGRGFRGRKFLFGGCSTTDTKLWVASIFKWAWNGTLASDWFPPSRGGVLAIYNELCRRNSHLLTLICSWYKSGWIPAVSCLKSLGSFYILGRKEKTSEPHWGRGVFCLKWPRWFGFNFANDFIFACSPVLCAFENESTLILLSFSLFVGGWGLVPL